jgi:hypothetical protein
MISGPLRPGSSRLGIVIKKTFQKKT